jgi:hypothetical protein
MEQEQGWSETSWDVPADIDGCVEARVELHLRDPEFLDTGAVLRELVGRPDRSQAIRRTVWYRSGCLFDGMAGRLTPEQATRHIIRRGKARGLRVEPGEIIVDDEGRWLFRGWRVSPAGE